MKAAGDNVIEGTPWFTPPEVITSSNPVDPRTDIYSLGALGYFLLTRHYIFDAETVEEIHEKQLSAEPVPPRQRTINPISLEMEQILLHCLEKDVAARPQSAAGLRALLLACEAAVDWPPEARAAWWDAYHLHPLTSPDSNPATPSTPLATVRIDLGSRTG